MATREYILKQASQKYESLNDTYTDFAKCVIDLYKYTSLLRAKILYNHLYYSSLSGEYIEKILQNKAYHTIIRHSNYSPRIIEIMTRNTFINSIDPNNYVKEFIGNLENPEKIWESAFVYHISDSAKLILFVLLLIKKVDAKFLLNCFIESINSAHEFDELFSFRDLFPSEFDDYIRKNRGRYPPKFGKWLADAYSLRNFAQYHTDPPKVKKVRRMANHVKEIIQKIEEAINK